MGFSYTGGGAAAEFEQAFKGFDAEAAGGAKEIEAAISGLRQEITLTRRLKRAQIKEMRIIRRGQKREKSIGGLIEQINESIEKCLKSTMNVKALAYVDPNKLTQEQMAALYTQLKDAMADYETNEKVLGELVSEIVDDIDHLMGQERIEINLAAAQSKLDDTGLAQLKEIKDRLIGVQAKFKSFFGRAA